MTKRTVRSKTKTTKRGRRPVAANTVRRAKRAAPKPTPPAVEAPKAETPELEEKHPGLKRIDPYGIAFDSVIGLTPCRRDFRDSYAFSDASVGELFAWYLGGPIRATDIWSMLLEQAEAVRQIARSFKTWHSDELPEGFALSGDWADIGETIAKRIEVLALLHHRTVEKIRMAEVNAERTPNGGAA